MNLFTISKFRYPKHVEDTFDNYTFYYEHNNVYETVFNKYDGSSLIELAKLQDKGGLTAIGSSNARCGWLCQLLIEILIVIVKYLPAMP